MRTTSPRLLSSWSPSLPVRRNSDTMDGWRQRREKGWIGAWVGKEEWESKKKKMNSITLQVREKGRGRNDMCGAERKHLEHGKEIGWKQRKSRV